MDTLEITKQLTNITTDYSQCVHTYCKRNGNQYKVKRGPIQTHICLFCGRTFLEGTESRSTKRIRVILAITKPETTISSVARLEKVSKELVRKYFYQIKIKLHGTDKKS